MQGYRDMRAARTRAAKRKIRRKKKRWGDKVIARHGQPGGGYGRRRRHG